MSTQALLAKQAEAADEVEAQFQEDYGRFAEGWDAHMGQLQHEARRQLAALQEAQGGAAEALEVAQVRGCLARPPSCMHCWVLFAEKTCKVHALWLGPCIYAYLAPSSPSRPLPTHSFTHVTVRPSHSGIRAPAVQMELAGAGHAQH